MRIGPLRHRIVLQVRTEDTTVQDSSGATTPTFTDLATVFAAIVPLSGRELVAAQALVADVSFRITIRCRPGTLGAEVNGVRVIPSMRVLYGQRRFEIDAVLDQDERSHELQLLCHEVT